MYFASLVSCLFVCIGVINILKVSQIFDHGKSVIFSFVRGVSNVSPLMLLPALLFKTGSFPERFEGE